MGEDRPEGGSHHLLVALGHTGKQVLREVGPAALVRCPLGAAPDGGDEAGVLVGDDELHPRKSALFERAQERPPEELVFGTTNGTPRISRCPSSRTPVAITTALETT